MINLLPLLAKNSGFSCSSNRSPRKEGKYQFQNPVDLNNQTKKEILFAFEDSIKVVLD